MSFLKHHLKTVIHENSKQISSLKLLAKSPKPIQTRSLQASPLENTVEQLRWSELLGREGFASLKAETLLRPVFFPTFYDRVFACYLQLGRVWSQICFHLLVCLSLQASQSLTSQRGKLLKLFFSILSFFFFLHYFCFGKMHLFKLSLVCTLENVIPFCTEFFKRKEKKNWPINRYNFL